MIHRPPLLPAPPAKRPLWTRKRLASLSLVVVVGAALAEGCTDSPTPHSTNSGSLNEGSFRYICLSEQDAAVACSGGEFPSALAVGARFDLDFEPYDETYATQVISGAASRIANRNQAWFEVLASGYTSMLALETDHALDFISFRGVRVDHYSLHASSSPADNTNLLNQGVQIQVDQSLELWAIPREAISNTRLAGALDYEWNIDDAEVASVFVPSGSRSVLLQAKRGGTSLVHIRAGGVESTFMLTVYGDNETTATDDSTASDDTSLTSSTTTTTTATTDSQLSSTTSSDTTDSTSTGSSDSTASQGESLSDSTDSTTSLWRPQ